MQGKSNIWMGILGSLIVLGGIVWLGSPRDAEPSGSAAQGAGELTVDETSFDFGTISMKAGTVEHSYTFRNASDAPVKIGRVYTSCMCTEATLTTPEGEMGPFGMPGHGFVPPANRVLQPGEEAEIKAVFDPAAHGPSGVGRVDRVVYVETNSGDVLEFEFTVNVRP